jgi:integrase
MPPASHLRDQPISMTGKPLTTSFLAREPVHVVSQRLGHATPAITMNIYAHVLPGNQRQAADRFAQLLMEAGA